MKMLLGMTENSVFLVGELQIAASVTTFQQQLGSVWWRTQGAELPPPVTSHPSHHQNVSDGGGVNK